MSSGAERALVAALLGRLGMTTLGCWFVFVVFFFLLLFIFIFIFFVLVFLRFFFVFLFVVVLIRFVGVGDFIFAFDSLRDYDLIEFIF